MLSNEHTMDLNVPNLVRSSDDERSPHAVPLSRRRVIEDGVLRHCEYIRFLYIRFLPPSVKGEFHTALYNSTISLCESHIL